MPYQSVPMEFDAYLRLAAASSMEWAAACRRLSECSEVTCKADRANLPVGSLSMLPLDSGALCYFATCQGICIDNLVCNHDALLLVREGELVLPDKGVRLLPGEAYCLPAVQGRGMTMTAGTRVLSVQWVGHSALPPMEQARRLQNPQVVALIDRFLYQSRFFQDHQHAWDLGCRLLTDIAAGMHGGKVRVAGPSGLEDRRLQRAIDRLEGDGKWRFDLGELAAWSGVSERNLYYLMKRETGTTPYRFYQRCRLLRVRRRLVDCQCGDPHISWYAADEGFSHLGRFAGLYREHFGELPSETVQWRRSLLEPESVEQEPVA